MKKNKGYVYDYRSWKLRFSFTKTTLVLANTPITNGFTKLSMLKDEIQKRNTSKNTSG